MLALRKIDWLLGMALGVFVGSVLSGGIRATLADSKARRPVADDLEEHRDRIQKLEAAVKVLQDAAEAQKKALSTRELSFTRATFGTSELGTDQGGSIELGNGAAGTAPYIDFHGYRPGDYNVRLINSADGQLEVAGKLVVKGDLTGPTLEAIGKRVTDLENTALRRVNPPPVISNPHMHPGGRP